MAELDLDALKQAAREAGGGCWFSTGWTAGSRGFEVGDLKSRDRICSDATERRAEFIAAANPATILELLGRLKAAEQTVQDYLRIDREKAQIAQRLEAVEKERDAAIERLDKAKSALRQHHNLTMGEGFDSSHVLTKLRVSAYQQSNLFANTVAALEESK